MAIPHRALRAAALVVVTVLALRSSVAQLARGSFDFRSATAYVLEGRARRCTAVLPSSSETGFRLLRPTRALRAAHHLPDIPQTLQGIRARRAGSAVARCSRNASRGIRSRVDGLCPRRNRRRKIRPACIGRVGKVSRNSRRQGFSVHSRRAAAEARLTFPHISALGKPMVSGQPWPRSAAWLISVSQLKLKVHPMINKDGSFRSERTQDFIVWALCFVLIEVRVLVPWLLGNESDTLAIARHFVTPDWIPNDWYLSQPIGYRTLFNYLIGYLIALVSTPWAIVIGRTTVALLFSKAIQCLSKDLQIRWYWVGFALYAFLRFPSIVAQEWIVGGLESKTFAYPLVLLGFSAMLRKKPTASLALLGLAFSFHVLIGIYGSLCTAGALFSTEDGRRLAREFAKRIWVFIIAGCGGFWAYLSHAIQSKSLSSIDLSRAESIYVHFRVPHHVFPGAWSGYWFIELAILIALFVFVFWKGKIHQKPAAAYALTGSMFFFIGLLLYETGQDTLLRFYWFRFPDTILPLFSCLMIASLASEWMDRVGSSGIRLGSYSLFLRVPCLFIRVPKH